MIGYVSRGIGRIAHLPALLEAPVERVTGGDLARFTYIAGWGCKPTAARARALAKRHDVDYLSLEDGFLRSLGLGVEGALLHSLIVDASGIYYDATRPSDLERLIQQADSLPVAMLARAGEAMHRLREARLSKYNHLPDVPLDHARWGLDPTVPCVLVVDQTFGDASVACGLADETTFRQMLEAAISENPRAQVIIKVHPDVMAGKKQGYLARLASVYGAVLCSAPISPWALLDAVERVYVVTSQLGFEALLAGVPVRCFGMPFYAGWGLTNDAVMCPRREGTQRSLEQVFAAAYLQYCRYINPYTGRRCEFEDTLALLEEQVRKRDEFQGRWQAVGFSRWKRGFLPFYLGSRAETQWIPRKRYLTEQRQPARSDHLLAWASQVTAELQEEARTKGQTLWKVEDGFLRSVGLGVDRVMPLSLVLDDLGIYYDATRPSRLETLLEEGNLDPSLLARAAALREQLLALKLSKYNVAIANTQEQQALEALPKNRRVVLVPGQVETDASIALGSPNVRSNLELLKRVRQHCPDAFIIYKPHPDVVGGGRYGDVDATHAADYCDLELSDTGMPVILDFVDEVHTMCSLTGFEALLRGISVVTHGMPFYAGWGLTRDYLSCARRTRKLSLDELVAGTLLCYPTYVDAASGDHVNAETAMALLADERARTQGQAVPWRRRLYCMARNQFWKH